MDWDHDICLSCDRQTADGEKFCSQTCRLADLERAGQSEPATPSSLSAQSSGWTSWQLPAASASVRPQFQLAPAVNFSAFKSSANVESPPASPRSRMPARQHSTSYFSQPTTSSTAYAQPSSRGLTSSPSRSSLSSISSSMTSSTVATPGLSEQALTHLRDYSGAFDTVRDWKRRVTLG